MLVSDSGSGSRGAEPELPDLDAKLAGRQRARGWGLFLMRKMVDDVHDRIDAAGHTLELVMRLDVEGDGDDRS